MELTKQFEGFSPTIYKDTQGKRTIGYGFNLENPHIRRLIPAEVQRGLRHLKISDANKVFEALYGIAQSDAIKFAGVDTFNNMPPDLKASLTDISYNLGAPRLSKFVKFQAALQRGDYPTAAEELKKSKWFYQVKDRAKYHYNLFKNYGKE